MPGSGYAVGSPNSATNYVLDDYSTMDPPRLSIVPSGTEVLVSWPTNFAGFVLESRDDFMTGTPWMTVTNPPAATGGQNTVTLPLLPSGERYFRLREP
jgi:hypothetical protein